MRNSRVVAFGGALILHLAAYCTRDALLWWIRSLPVSSADLSYISWVFTALGSLAVYLLPVLYYLKRTAGGINDILHPPGDAHRSQSDALILEFIFAAAAMLGAVNLVGAATEALLGLLPLPTVEARGLPDGIVLQVLTFVSSVLVAPVMEELLFRGVALNALHSFGKPTAVLLSGGLFALMHYSLYSVPYAFFAGCIISYLAIRANSLRVAVGLHFLNNLTAFVGLLIEKYSGITASEIFTAVLMVTCGASALVTAVWLAVRWRMLPREKVGEDGDGFFDEVAPTDGDGSDRGESLRSEADTNKCMPLRNILCAEMILYVTAAIILCISRVL